MADLNGDGIKDLSLSGYSGVLVVNKGRSLEAARKDAMQFEDTRLGFLFEDTQILRRKDGDHFTLSAQHHAFWDWDADGDLDLLVSGAVKTGKGIFDRKHCLLMYRNEGTANNFWL